ncbi:MAG TPA: tRNA uridine-5-carboxymethylaminomethyl(34) synthesis GTPase MnmE [Hyphomicrobiales bacterium]|nr:tRNA uridine-5-carboxymethylaminomethyl(34) synthesis GTPase MnmE [Hyphomicrobiales bacterium]
MANSADTICALATPVGRGGVGIIRVSGPQALALCQRLSGLAPPPNLARLASFRDAAGALIDQGLVLYFQAPASFTGEDVVEFHIHGSPIVADLILSQLNAWGARLARPGEFSEQAFLNDKLDLAQAEAIADLIDSASHTAARYAVRSLRGDFSDAVNALVTDLTRLRVYVEAALDFPDEDVDFLAEQSVKDRLQILEADFARLLQQAKEGVSLREGLHLVLAGAPNAGKSSLLNALAGFDRAIVTDIPGTTRDLLDTQLTLQGLPLHITDTAGLRESTDPVEQEGIRRARQALQQADGILLVIDASQIMNTARETNQGNRLIEDTADEVTPTTVLSNVLSPDAVLPPDLAQEPLWQEFKADPELVAKTLLVLNKIDLCQLPPGTTTIEGRPCIRLSALQRDGLEHLSQALLDLAGFVPREEGGFIARRRHLSALLSAQDALHDAKRQFNATHSGELMAEDLRRAQDALGEITGKVSSDDLLGEIFGSFCIGK